mmetsp:Transcript_111441/g.279064  ORF Transcript_111441/g.279064 Transcript_111441/m.279064 type:complete len:299 (-) Transcript_111441:1013-1909(-)
MAKPASTVPFSERTSTTKPSETQAPLLRRNMQTTSPTLTSVHLSSALSSVGKTHSAEPMSLKNTLTAPTGIDKPSPTAVACVSTFTTMPSREDSSVPLWKTLTTSPTRNAPMSLGSSVGGGLAGTVLPNASDVGSLDAGRGSLGAGEHAWSPGATATAEGPAGTEGNLQALLPKSISDPSLGDGLAWPNSLDVSGAGSLGAAVAAMLGVGLAVRISSSMFDTKSLGAATEAVRVPDSQTQSKASSLDGVADPGVARLHVSTCSSFLLISTRGAINSLCDLSSIPKAAGGIHLAMSPLE